jgi:hypothetical protein
MGCLTISAAKKNPRRGWQHRDTNRRLARHLAEMTAGDARDVGPNCGARASGHFALKSMKATKSWVRALVLEEQELDEVALENHMPHRGQGQKS